MSHITPEKGCQINFFLEIAQNPCTGVLFNADQEYDTLRCHISSMNHAILEKGCQISKVYKYLNIGILV